MTFVGKVLVVVNVVLTMCIAMFAGGVYTVQTNWKKKHDTATQQLNQQLTAERAEVTKVKEANTKLTKDLADMTQDKNRFEGQADNANKTLVARTNELNRMKLQRDQLQTTSDELRKNNDIQKAELKNLRDALTQVHATLKTLRTKITSLEDEKFDLQRKEQRLVKKHDSALELIVAYRKALVANGIADDPSKYANVELKPIPSDGLVEDVLHGGRDKSTLVKVSVGSDDNISEGTILYVFRLSEKGKYLGKIKIIGKPGTDSAIGELIDDPKNGKIQKGDNVSPKI